MNNKSKRKNDDVPLSTYDQTWLFRLYRWLRWDKSQSIFVDESPARVRHRLESLARAFDRLYRVKMQPTPLLYEFHIAVNNDEVTDQGSVTGQVIAKEDGKSVILLCAYPDSGALGCATFLTTMGILIACGALFNIVPFNTVMEGTGTGLLILAVIGLAWHRLFQGRNAAVEIIAKRLAPFADHASEKIKRKSIHAQQAQK